MPYRKRYLQKLNYHIDNTLSKGTSALLAALGIVFFGVALITAILVLIADSLDLIPEHLNFLDAYWGSLMHVLDQGTITGDGDAGWGYRIIMFITTMCGIFIVSSLISILNTGFQSKLDEMQKGRSIVFEDGHTVILGWSSKVFTIISELVIANENQKKSCIVILADKDKTEMEDEIKMKVGRTGKTRVICRHGNPMDLDDLKIANLNNSKSIIILSPEEDKSDSYVVKSVLAIINNPNRRNEKYNIIAEIENQSNKEIAQIVGKDELTVIVSKDIISKITVQTSGQSGLSLIYNDLLDFANVEMYILKIKNTSGLLYEDVIFAFDDTTIIGMQKSDKSIILNPPLDTVIALGDKFVVIALDDEEIEFKQTKKPKQGVKIIEKQESAEKPALNTLILGWNENGKTIIQELDNYVGKGSKVVVASEFENLSQKLQEETSTLQSLNVVFQTADINKRQTINKLMLDYDFEQIIILSYSDVYQTQQCDAITLVALMHLRDMLNKQNKNISVVSEMLDSKNRALASLHKSDDFIISDQLISLILAQLSENKYLSAVFEDLFDADGVEIYLKPVSRYIDKEFSSNFYQILEKGLSYGETPIGYKQIKYANDAERYFGIVLNPRKSDLISFEEGDMIIVLAED